MAEITDAEYAQIGGWVFATPCCIMEDIAGVLSPATLRGGDRDLTGQDGQAPRPTHRGPIIFTLGPFVINGDFDPEGVLQVDYRAGLRANLQTMYAEVLPTSTPPFTRPFVHHMGDGTEWIGDCKVTSVQGPTAVGNRDVRVSLVVHILTGVLAEAGS